MKSYRTATRFMPAFGSKPLDVAIDFLLAAARFPANQCILSDKAGRIRKRELAVCSFFLRNQLFTGRRLSRIDQFLPLLRSDLFFMFPQLRAIWTVRW
jgi:hypothetical protein